jgi:hypothetical protein
MPLHELDMCNDFLAGIQCERLNVPLEIIKQETALRTNFDALRLRIGNAIINAKVETSDVAQRRKAASMESHQGGGNKGRGGSPKGQGGRGGPGCGNSGRGKGKGFRNRPKGAPAEVSGKLSYYPDGTLFTGTYESWKDISREDQAKVTAGRLAAKSKRKVGALTSSPKKKPKTGAEAPDVPLAPTRATKYNKEFATALKQMESVMEQAQLAQAEADQAEAPPEAIEMDVEEPPPVEEAPRVRTLTPNAGTVMGRGAHPKVKFSPKVGGHASNKYGKVIPPGWTMETFHTAAGREETWSPPATPAQTKKAAAEAATKGFAKAKTPVAEAQE